MRRIEQAYCNRFIAHIGTLKARNIKKAEDWFWNKVAQVATVRGVSRWEAAKMVWEDIWIRSRLSRTGDYQEEIKFRCDSGLGKLARWLRAAGYYAEWRDAWDDKQLIELCLRDKFVLLTTDSLIMERRVVRTGQIRAYWLPPSFSVKEQLKILFRELCLTLQTPRCMSCGGILQSISKEEAKEQIPPRTYHWLNEYFICTWCKKIFWQGTHWIHIRNVLHLEQTTLPKDRVSKG